MLGEISLAVAAVRDLLTHSGREALTLLWGQSLLFWPAWNLSFLSIFDQVQNPLDLTVRTLVLGRQRGVTRPIALVTVYRLPLLLLIVLQRLVGKVSGAGAGAAEPGGMDMAQWEQESVELSGGVASRAPSLVPSARDLWPPGWGGPISR